MARSSNAAEAAHEFDTFISYSRKDAAAVEIVCEALDQAGLVYWRDTHEEVMGDDWRRDVEDALSISALCLILHSGSADASEAVALEVELASALKLPRLVYRLEDVPFGPHLDKHLGRLTWHPGQNPPSEDDLQFIIHSVRTQRARRRFPDGRLGPYKIERELGRGSIATVYLAEPTAGAKEAKLHKQVALKVLDPLAAMNQKVVKSLEEEATLSGRIEHPNVVRLHRVLWHEGATALPYLVLEYIDGRSLREELQRKEWIPCQLCQGIAHEVARGLSAVHAVGAVHRDLRPANIVMTREQDLVKIMDLGMARVSDSAGRIAQSGLALRSFRYAAPEQIDRSLGEIDGRTDLFTLGVVLYELLTGKHPFLGEDRVGLLQAQQEGPRPLLHEVGIPVEPFFAEVVYTLLQASPGERFESAAALCEVLKQNTKSAWWKQRGARHSEADTSREVYVRPLNRTSFYGRSKELAALDRWFDQTKAGSGRVLLVLGETGIGKTRLVDEFVRARRAAGETILYLFGTNAPGAAATPVGALSEALCRHFGSGDLESSLQPYLESTPEYARAFAALLRQAPVPPGAPEPDAEMLPGLFAQVLRALAKEHPVVFLIDDLHFMPQDGLCHLLSISHALRESSVLLVAAGEPRVPSRWRANFEAQRHVHSLSPRPLGDEAEAAILAELLESEDLGHELVERCAVHSKGVPLYLLALIDEMKTRRLLYRSADGRWRCHATNGQLAVPEGVAQILAQRLVGLEEDEQELLEFGACWGMEFDYELISAAAEMRPRRVLRRLAALEQERHVVRSQGRRFSFDHPLLQAAVLEAMSPAIRTDCHRTLAETLEAQTPAAADEPAGVEGERAYELCYHYLAGERGRKALRFLDAALRQLSATYRASQAVALVERALAVDGLLVGVKRVEMLLWQMAQLQDLGRFDEEESALEEATTIAERAGDGALKARVRASAGWLNLRRGRLDEAEALLAEGLDLARAAEDRRVEAQILRITGNVWFRRGHHEEARRWHERHASLADELASPNEQLIAAGNMGATLWALGYMQDSLASFRRQLDLARRLKSPRREVPALCNIGSLRAALGHIEEAKRASEEGRAMSARCGFLRPRLQSELGLGVLAAASGELGVAEQRLRHVLDDVAVLTGDPLAAEAQLALGAVYQKTGDESRARACFKESAQLAEAMNAAGASALALAALASLPGGDAAAAAAACERAWPHMDRVSTLEARIWLWRASGDERHRVEALAQLDALESASPEFDRDGLLSLVPFGDALRGPHGQGPPPDPEAPTASM